jgi:hypothetical protein
MPVTRDEKCFAVLAIVVFLLTLFLASIPKSHARDDGRYANSPLRDWFHGLTSKLGGRCCDFADGNALEDPEWRIVSDADKPAVHYQVFVGGVWRDILDGQVIDEPNKVGKAFVWTWYRDGEIKIRCFLAGPSA